MSKEADLFIREAKKMAARSHYRHRVGAVVVRNGKILGKGFNKVHHSGISTEGICAERDALFNTLASQRTNSIVYVLRVNKQGELRLACPCHRCQQVMKKMGVSSVIYSTSDNRFERISL